MKRVSFFLLALFALIAAGCGSSGVSDEAGTSSDGDGEIVVSDVWTREPATGQPNAAVYATIDNGTDRDVTLTSVEVSVDTDATELHEVLPRGGMMVMQEREGGIGVAAGESVELAPGGFHVMLLGIDPASYPSDGVDVEFTFDSGDVISATARVEALPEGAMDEGSESEDAMGDSGHGDDAMSKETESEEAMSKEAMSKEAESNDG